MTRAVVVYESMFSNTEQVAYAIADGLRSGFEVDVMSVESPPSSVGDTPGLVVVGGPTHAFSMSREPSRAQAIEDGATANSQVGLREWVEAWLATRDRSEWAGVTAATFDTKMTSMRRLPGSAAHAAARLLRRGGLRVAHSASFYVSSGQGPLADGELARAEAWGRRLAEQTTGSRAVG